MLLLNALEMFEILFIDSETIFFCIYVLFLLKKFGNIVNFTEFSRPFLHVMAKVKI